MGVAPDQGVAGNAILPDGRMVVTATQRDSWFWTPAVMIRSTPASCARAITASRSSAKSG
jgi:hypothetical protein